MSKSILEVIQSCSVQKTARKNTKYSRNETILKIGHHMQSLQPLQNRHFGSKIKIPKNMSKSILKVIQSSCVQKTARKNTKYSRNETILKIGHHMQSLQPLQNRHFGSKIKIPKNMSKSILEVIQSCCVQKTARKNTKYWRNETILKIGHHMQSLQPLQNRHFGSKIKIPKNMSKSILKVIQSCCVQKPLEKTAKYSRNETILKIGHHMQSLQPLQNRHFGSKIKIPKNMSKSILEVIQSSSVQKTARKNTQIFEK